MRFLLLLIVLAGCVGDPNARRPDNVDDDVPGVVTKVWKDDGSWGTAAVVGEHLVATVAHVVDGDEPAWACGDKPATEVQRIPTTGYEAIVILRVEFSYDDDEVFRWNPGGTAYTAWTWQQGRIKLSRDSVLPGDSGSPVLDRAGRLMGHVSACQLCGTEDQVNIHSPYPSLFDHESLR